MAWATHDAALQLGPIFLRDALGPEFLVIAPAVGTRAEFLAAPIPLQLRATGHQNRRDVGARRAHEQGWRGLIAATQQHHTVERIGRDRLLYVHAHEIAIQ